MIRVLLLASLVAATPAFAQTGPAPAPSPILAPPAAGMVHVALETSAGRIVVDLDRAHAPITAANFLRYLDQKKLDGVRFYRIVKAAPDFGFVQFGLNQFPARLNPPIKHEPTSQTGIKHTDGTISIARLAPGTAQGDFTIVVGDQPSFDAGPQSGTDDKLGYAAFGHVVQGMDVVHQILDGATDPAKGPFKGEMAARPVTIVHARRLP